MVLDVLFQEFKIYFLVDKSHLVEDFACRSTITVLVTSSERCTVPSPRKTFLMLESYVPQQFPWVSEIRHLICASSRWYLLCVVARVCTFVCPARSGTEGANQNVLSSLKNVHLTSILQRKLFPSLFDESIFYFSIFRNAYSLWFDH